jgi:hypothetical protein
MTFTFARDIKSPCWASGRFVAGARAFQSRLLVPVARDVAKQGAMANKKGLGQDIAQWITQRRQGRGKRSIHPDFDAVVKPPFTRPWLSWRPRISSMGRPAP